MLDLTLREAKRFRELTGYTYQQVIEYLDERPCQRHRLVIGACKACRKAPGRCEAHDADFVGCSTCTLGFYEAPEDMLAGIVFILRERKGGPADWDEFLDTAQVLDILGKFGTEVLEAGNAVGREAAATSSPNGSRPSSKRIRGSAAKRDSGA